MSNKSVPSPHPSSMTLDDMMREFAAGLRDVLEETSESYLKERPEDAFVDLACRLVLRLRDKLTVVPAPGKMEDAKLENAAAAQRIFDILTQWMIKNPGCSYRIRTSVSGKFQISATSASGTKVFFGESAQDVHAQIAQTIQFSGGEL